MSYPYHIQNELNPPQYPQNPQYTPYSYPNQLPYTDANSQPQSMINPSYGMYGVGSVLSPSDPTSNVYGSQQGNLSTDNIYGSQQGNVPTDNIYGSQQGNLSTDNIYGSQQGNLSTDNTYGTGQGNIYGSQHVNLPTSNIYGSQQGNVPTDNIYGSQQGNVPTDNIYGSQQGNVPTGNIYGTQQGNLSTDNIYGSQQGNVPTDNVYGSQQGLSTSNIYGTQQGNGGVYGTQQGTVPTNNIYGTQHDSGNLSTDNIYGSQQGNVPTDNIYGSQQGNVPTDNIYSTGQGNLSTDNIYGTQQQGSMPTSNIYGSQQGNVPTDNIYGSQQSNVPTDNIYGSQQGNVPTDNIYGSQQGNVPTDNIYSTQQQHNTNMPYDSQYGTSNVYSTSMGLEPPPPNSTPYIPLASAIAEEPVSSGGNMTGLSAPGSPTYIYNDTMSSHMQNAISSIKEMISNFTRGSFVNFKHFHTPKSTITTTEGVSSERQQLTDEEYKHRKAESIFWKGNHKLIVDPDINPTTDQVNDHYLKKMVDGERFIRYSTFEMKSSIHCCLTEDFTTLRHSSYGFIYLKYVSEIKIGKKTTLLSQSNADEKACFSLIYGPNSIDFEALKPEVCEYWIQGLIYAINKCKRILSFYDTIKEFWCQTYSINASISYDQAVKLICTISETQSPNKNEMSTRFARADVNHDGLIQFDEFVDLVKSFRVYSSMEHIFDKYAKGNKLDAHGLLKFLHEEQKDTYTTIDDAKYIISSLQHGLEYLDFPLFCEYLNDYTLNSAFDIERYGYVYQDMTKPLSWYYVYSSHNTYCSSDQIKSKASVEMYAKVLRDGCRCVELDIWDGQNRPIIKHGNTPMKEIEFEDVVKCIRENAFITTKFPVILSLENHCSKTCQEKIAEGFVRILGNFLEIPPPSIASLPSPESLQYKILLKGPISASYYDDPIFKDENPKTKPDKICEQITKITYLRSSHLSSLSNPSKNPLEMSSFEETKHEKISKSNEMFDMMNYCKIQLSRIYPKGTRIDSSNYSPITGWNMGCQLVALNCQTMDEHAYINMAKFEDNGGCGYVLKPPIMMESKSFDVAANPHYFKTRNPNSINKLNVHIIGARMLPTPKTGVFKKKVHPFVTVKSLGFHLDNNEHRSNIDKINELFFPHWDSKFQFSYHLSETSILLFQVDCKKQGTRIAEAAISTKCIREGYRTLTLRNYRGAIMPYSTLLVHFSFEN